MKKMLFLLLALPLLLAQPGASAPQPQTNVVYDVGNGLEATEGAWLNDLSQTCGGREYDSTAAFRNAALMLVVITLAVALLYMLGALFDSPMITALAKQEMYEILLTVMIFLGFFATWGLISNTVLGTHGTNDGFMGVAQDYSKTMILKISKDTSSLALFNMALYMYYTAPIRLGKTMYSGVSLNFGAVLRPMIDGIGSSASLLSVAMGEWLANINLLCFIKSVLMPMFFPLGLLLRSVPQLRGGGNALIAFSFALFIVYPMMLTINYEAYRLRYGDFAYGTPVQNAIASFFAQSGFGDIAIAAIAVKLITGTVLGPLLIVSAVMVFIETLKDIIYTVFILSFFLGLINIFVTLTFAKELSRFLGTEINVSAFIKLI